MVGLRSRADRLGVGEVALRGLEGDLDGEELGAAAETGGGAAGAGAGAGTAAGDAGDASRRRLAAGSVAGDAVGVCWFFARRKVVLGSGTAVAREGMMWLRW